MALKIIITGTTGMVGEGVLLHCLNDPRVEKILTVSRKSAGHSNPTTPASTAQASARPG